MRREITDGLTRSYLKAKKYSEALTASQELVSDINIFPAIITYQFYRPKHARINGKGLHGIL
jgi:hypothetical protein